MSMLVPCPHCGPREVADLRCAGEVTRRPKGTPTVRELNEYIYFRANEAGLQREWWFCRACEDWFLAERNTVTNEVLRTWLPEAPAPVPEPDAAPPAEPQQAGAA